MTPMRWLPHNSPKALLGQSSPLNYYSDGSQDSHLLHVLYSYVVGKSCLTGYGKQATAASWLSVPLTACGDADHFTLASSHEADGSERHCYPGSRNGGEALRKQEMRGAQKCPGPSQHQQHGETEKTPDKATVIIL